MAILKSNPELEYSEYSDDSLNSLNNNNNDTNSSSDSNYSVYNYDEVPENKSWASTLPTKKGLYNPEYEKDNCGVGK